MKFLKLNKIFFLFYLNSFVIFSIIFIFIPSQYITKTIIKPITRIDFDNKIFELSLKQKYLGLEKEYLKKAFEDEKKVIIKIENVDSLGSNSPSPLVLFYEFFRISENQNYKNPKFEINFFESSFEYFFIVSIKGKNIEENEKELSNFLKSSNKLLNISFNEYLLNSNIEKKFDVNQFNFIDTKIENLQSKETKIGFKKFLLFNFVISFFISVFLYGIKIKYQTKKKK